MAKATTKSTKKQADDADPTRVVLQKVRLSFPHLFQPYSINPDDDPKFSAMLLISKKDKASLRAIRAAEKAAIEKGRNTKFGGKVPPNLATILKDADEDGSAEDYPEREGHFYMSVSANPNRRPAVVDTQVQKIVDESEVYSGVYANVSVTAFPYTFGKKKGISFGLNNVQILGYGESLGGGKRADEEFEVVDDYEDDDDDLM